MYVRGPYEHVVFDLLQVLGGRRPFTAFVLDANGQEVCQAGSNLQIPHLYQFLRVLI